MVTQTTNGITIQVYTRYIAEDAEPETDKYVFGYHVVIENENTFSVQLLRRAWVVCDAGGTVRKTGGDGVVGAQPVIHPGETHEYVSHCILPTEIGRMYGSYTMQRLGDGAYFDVAIPAFDMVAPFKLN